MSPSALPQSANPANFYTNPPSSMNTTRVFAQGTLFQTHTFHIPSFPSHADHNVVRAHSITKKLNGSAPSILTLLAQFNDLNENGGRRIDPQLIAPMSGAEEGVAILQQLEKEGIGTRYCKIVQGAGVPGAWVFKSKNGTLPPPVILHNPLPDMTHEEFVSLLGPILIPENYVQTTPTSSNVPELPSPDTPPFEWLHFSVSANSVQSVLSNIQGLDGLARERGWRGKVIFSLEVSGSNRHGGVENLIPFVDVIFYDKAHAVAAGYTSPRPFLLAQSSIAAPHALLIINWSSPPSSSSISTARDPEEGGSALLSLPTREYLQSSAFVPPLPAPPPMEMEKMSMKSGSDFYADGHRSSYAFSSPTSSRPISNGDEWDMYTLSHTPSFGLFNSREESREKDEEDEPEPDHPPFIASMIYGLTRRLLPGGVWSPVPLQPRKGEQEKGKGDPRKWGLDECLRFSTEYTGRRRYAFSTSKRHRNKDVNREVLRDMSEAGW